ncbi:MAG: hypothetical protein ACRDY1_09775 [Acidimicrobiales bacterium]
MCGRRWLRWLRWLPSPSWPWWLGIPEGTVRSRLFYALQSLGLTLDEMEWAP